MYQTLRHPDSFRLLKLEHSSSETQWKGALVETRLPLDAHAADALKYVALSYCWGEPSYNVPEEHSIEISQSLSTALGHILLQFAERSVLYIWIDQICINQHDDCERKQQVGVMWRIYEGAEQVIGWLGPAFDGSEKALADLVLFAAPADGEVPSEEWRQALQRFMDNSVQDDILQYLGSIMRPGSDVRGRMLSLFKMPWFSRCWIAQEACLASNLSIHCGFQSVSGEQLFRALRNIQQVILPIASPWLTRPFRNALALLHTRNVVQGRQPLSFPYLLQRLSFLGCGQDQDRINALFGIVRSNAWFMPEYCPAPELFVKFAIGHMRQSQSLEILHFAGVTDPARHEFCDEGYEKKYNIAWPAGDLPSWVPDWRVEHRPLPMLPAGSYSVAQERDLPPFHVPVDSAQKRLVLQGKLLSGHVKTCCLPYLDRFELEENPDVLYATDNWCNQFFVNFLEAVDLPLASHYRSCTSFSQWHQSLTQAGNDPKDLLLRFARTLIMNGMVESIDKSDRNVPEERVLEHFLEYAKLHFVVDSHAFGLILETCIDNLESIEMAVAYGYLAEEICRYRTLFVGSDGVVGLGLAGICPSDRICLFPGLKTPFILHPQDGHFQLRGECFIDSLRDISFKNLEESEREIVLE